MADFNIQIKQRNGAIWDSLFPITKAENVTESTSKRFVTDTEKATWNAKQTALGFTPENLAKKGVANGYASLDATGKVPSSELPSYVDDVLEYASFASLPATGETGKIYVTTDNNKTFRWGGSAYAEISASIALGTTSTTAYRGDYGNTAYLHSQAAHAPSNAQKNSDITKAEIEAKLTGTIASHTHGGLTPAAHAASHVTGGSDVIANAVSGGASGLFSGSDKAKLDGIAASANNYIHPTTAGNHHVPTGGASGQLLKYSGTSGTASWSTVVPSDIGASKFTVSATEPATPSNNDFWYEVI